MTPTLALHHQQLGEGPPLLVLHGLFGSGTNWRSIARHLGKAHTVYLLDLRNHGESPHADAMDYHVLAADVAAFMDANGIAGADVIGHSMGGKTAMRLALDDPSRVQRLMVVDIAPAPSGSDHDQLIDTLLALPLEGLSRRTEADEALAASVPEAGLRAFLLQNLRSDGGGLAWRINLPGIRAAMPDLLAFPVHAAERYDGPTRFLRGGASDYVRDEHLPIIKAHFAAATVETMDGAGHWLHAEQPARFIEVANDFLGSSTEPGR